MKDGVDEAESMMMSYQGDCIKEKDTSGLFRAIKVHDM